MYYIKNLYKSESDLIKVMAKETLNSEKWLQISELTFFHYSWYFSFKQWLFSMKVSNYESQKFWLLPASTEEFSSHLSLITTQTVSPNCVFCIGKCGTLWKLRKTAWQMHWMLQCLINIWIILWFLATPVSDLKF